MADLPFLTGRRRGRTRGKDEIVSPEEGLHTADHWSLSASHGGGLVSLIRHQTSRIKHHERLHHALVEVGPGQVCGHVAGLREEVGLHESSETQSPGVTHGLPATTLLQEARRTVSKPVQGEALIGYPQLILEKGSEDDCTTYMQSWLTL